MVNDAQRLTLTFRIFADDTNLYASARDLKSLETLINSELGKAKVWCDVNKLSINFIKTNYMILKSNRKASGSIEVKLQNMDGSSYLLERKDHIKYLGIMIDKSISWKYHIFYTCFSISSNVSVISKLSHYLSIRQLKQLYYNLIYPYLSYAIIAWGSANKTHLKRLQSKQNTVLTLMFFATTSGPYRESALLFLNLLDVLAVNNVYRLHALNFTHLWHKGHPPSLFDNLFQYASCRHTHNTSSATYLHGVYLFNSKSSIMTSLLLV